MTDDNLHIKEKLKELECFTNEKYLNRHLVAPIGLEKMQRVVNSLQQASAFLKAAIKVEMQVKPLLLYYASLNYFLGLITLVGKTVDSNTHGMTIDANNEDNKDTLLDIKIEFKGKSSLQAISDLLKVDMPRGVWPLRDFLDSIPEISTEYIRAFQRPSHAILVESSKISWGANIDRIHVNEGLNVEELINLITKETPCFKETYLDIQIPREKLLVLIRKLDKTPKTEKSLDGRRYIIAGHREENNKLDPLPAVLNNHIALFALSYFCRYFPEIWVPCISATNISIKKMLVI